MSLRRRLRRSPTPRAVRKRTYYYLAGNEREAFLTACHPGPLRVIRSATVECRLKETLADKRKSANGPEAEHTEASKGHDSVIRPAADIGGVDRVDRIVGLAA